MNQHCIDIKCEYVILGQGNSSLYALIEINKHIKNPIISPAICNDWVLNKRKARVLDTVKHTYLEWLNNPNK